MLKMQDVKSRLCQCLQSHNREAQSYVRNFIFPLQWIADSQACGECRAGAGVLPSARVASLPQFSLLCSLSVKQKVEILRLVKSRTCDFTGNVSWRVQRWGLECKGKFTENGGAALPWGLIAWEEVNPPFSDFHHSI